MAQLTHYSSPNAKMSHNVILLCDQLQGPANMGAIFRLADAFGVEKVIFNNEVPIHSNRFKRTARNTEKSVTFCMEENLTITLQNLVTQGFVPIALEITTTSIPVQQYVKPPIRNIVLIVGNEKNGVSKTLLEVSTHVHIDMFGVNSSMNVAQASAIALYELTKP